MADAKGVKKARKRKDPQDAPKVEKDEATKEEIAIAKWMRKNVPIKKTKFLNHTVEYFTANKAVDQLMDSPWAKPKKVGEEALFTTRESIVDYLDAMLKHRLYHRARKIVVPESELKSKKKKDKEKEEEGESKADVKENKEKEKEEKVSKKEVDTVTAAESSQAEGDSKGDKEVAKRKKDDGEKKRRKIRLDMHLDQRFVDGTDAYVWLYEPTPYYNYFFGFLVVLAVIAVCLFPLWPSSVRLGVYYLSLAAAGFLVFILALAVIRMVVFGLVWTITFGRHHLWLLPNLTEDVGFLASFWPLYKYEYKPGGGGISDDKSSKKKKGESKTDDETNETQELLGSEDKDGSESAKPADQSETESEGSQKSQTGKDFEIVEHDEVDE